MGNILAEIVKGQPQPLGRVRLRQDEPGNLTDNVDYIRGVDAEGDFITVDPDSPALPAESENVLALLAQIRDRLPAPGQRVWDLQVRTILNAATGELPIDTNYPATFVYVPNVPRDCVVYAGMGRTLLLATLTVGKSLSAPLPPNSGGVFITYAAGTIPAQFTALFTTQKWEVTIT